VRDAEVDWRSSNNYRLQPEETAVTFNVGLVGTDGVVLASDTKVSFWEQTRTSSTASKLYSNPETGIACAVSGDEVTPFIAREVCQTRINDGLSEDDVFTQLHGVATSAWQLHVPKKRDNSPERNPHSRLLIVLPRCNFPLWSIAAGPNTGSGTKCYRDKAHDGDPSNAAKYFLEFYAQSKLRPMRELVFLAAHTIRTAAILNPTGVGGLEILTWDFGAAAPRFLSNDEIATLTQRSSQLTSSIDAAIFGT
jgi:hypothetical protein